MNKNDLHTMILKNLFPAPMVEEIVKSTEQFNAEQFTNLYRILLTERTALIKMFEEQDTSPSRLNGVDRTIELLKSKYGKQ
jgi:hypothetical protein